MREQSLVVIVLESGSMPRLNGESLVSNRHLFNVKPCILLARPCAGISCGELNGHG